MATPKLKIIVRLNQPHSPCGDVHRRRIPEALRSRRRAFRPDTSNTPDRKSRISGHMTGLRRGFGIFRHSRHLPDRHRSLIPAFHIDRRLPRTGALRFGARRWARGVTSRCGGARRSPQSSGSARLDRNGMRFQRHYLLSLEERLGVHLSAIDSDYDLQET